MLNLSDNELDRLSREAASQHDPGDLMGPQSWERLELRLDKELGRAGPDMSRGLRGIRRLPFQYAPVLLLVVGVTWYFVKAKGRKPESSGSPPLTVVKTPHQQAGADSISSLNNSAYSDKSTSTFYPGGDSPSGTAAVTPTAPDRVIADDHRTASGKDNPFADKTYPGPNSAAPGPANHSGTSSGPDRTVPDLANHSGTSSGPARTVSVPDHTASGLANNAGANHTGSSLTHLSGSDRTGGLTPHRPHRYPGDNKTSGNQTALQDHTTRQTRAPSSDEPSDPEHVYIQHPFSLHGHPGTNDLALRADSALQAYAARTAKDPGKKPGPSNHINRGLAIGLQFAPDFTSVNALSGDKPGSSIGLTLDYQVLDRLHLGTGILYSRKNYTARGMDYHVPPDYFMQNFMKPVDFVKGTMNMLEIPITVRYDFSVTGNTIFFASAGVSSYLFGKEHCNYYYDFFGREACRNFQYSNTPNGLFSSINLSLGVETGISNSVSILVAPYMKLPTSDMGFGKVRMNSVGINFAIHYAPVISRNRHP